MVNISVRDESQITIVRRTLLQVFRTVLGIVPEVEIDNALVVLAVYELDFKAAMA